MNIFMFLLKAIGWYLLFCIVATPIIVALFFAINYAFGRGWISQKYNPDLLWGPIFSEYEIAEREK